MSTLNRLELTPTGADEESRYKKITCRVRDVEDLFVTLFLQAHPRPPESIVLDLDATDDPVHGHQLGRFFHGYYKGYCYLPLSIFCGNHLLCAKLRPADIDASAGSVTHLRRIVTQLRQAWPEVKITIRADGGFGHAPIMAWCEANGVDYILGLAQNPRLRAAIAEESDQARQQFEATGGPARVFAELRYRTLDSWSRERRVVAKAEHLSRGATPASWSPRCRPKTARHRRSTRWIPVPAARRRTESRNSNCTCLPIGPVPARCGPTSCGCSSHRSRMSCSMRCVGGACRGPTWRLRHARRSG